MTPSLEIMVADITTLDVDARLTRTAGARLELTAVMPTGERVALLKSDPL